jgi:hypothetical protein
MALSEQVQSTRILEQLQTIIDRAEQGAAFSVLRAEVQFTAIISKVAGIKTPQIWVLPKDLAKAELNEKTISEITLILKKTEVVASTFEMVNDLALAIQAVREGLQALYALRDKFDASAKIALSFHVNTSGSIEFIFKAGGSSEYAHRLTLELKPNFAPVADSP